MGNPVNVKNTSKPRIIAGLLRLAVLCVTMAAVFLLSACGLDDDEDEKKVRDLDFTVVGETDVPEELQKIIGEKRNQPFKLTYSDGQNLYIVVGYGPQKTGGYSIQVEELYLTENAIVLDTELIGPAKGESVAQETSYPVIIIRTELSEKPVIFD